VKKHAFALGVALAGIIEVSVQADIYLRVPSEASWDQAAAYVRSQLQPGDGIVFAPHWVDPTGRQHFGDLISVEEAARPDRTRQARIWEVSIRGKHHPEATGRVAEERTFGRVRVRRIERPAAEVLFDFTASLPGRRHVGEVGFLPYMCLPLRPGETLPFRDVPIGASIAVGGGIADFQSRYNSDAPVTLETTVDGQRLPDQRFDNNGWRRATLDTAALAGRKVTVEFHLGASRAPTRTFCFHAEVHR